MTDKKNPPPPAPFNANDLVQTWWGQPSPSGPARLPDTNTREAIERVRKALESKSKTPTPVVAAAAAETPQPSETPATSEAPKAPKAPDTPGTSEPSSTDDAEPPVAPSTT